MLSISWASPPPVRPIGFTQSSSPSALVFNASCVQALDGERLSAEDVEGRSSSDRLWRISSANGCCLDLYRRQHRRLHRERQQCDDGSHG